MAMVGNYRYPAKTPDTIVAFRPEPVNCTSKSISMDLPGVLASWRFNPVLGLLGALGVPVKRVLKRSLGSQFFFLVCGGAAEFTEPCGKLLA